MCGISDDKLKERLLRDDKLTLDKAIDICRAAEESQKHFKMFEGGGNLTVNKINRKPNQNRFTGTPSTKPESHIESRLACCSRCGHTHPPKSCPAFSKTCGACGRNNHFMSMCRTKARNPTKQFPKQKRHKVH